MQKSFVVITILLILFSRCVQKESPEGHEHDHGPEPVSHTLYGKHVELFVELKPLVLGQKSKFAAHFTLLGEQFLPLSEGKVTVSLIVGDKGIRQVVDSPSTPGIFRLALTPQVSGLGKLIFDIETKQFKDQIRIDNVEVYAADSLIVPSITETAGGNNVQYLKEQSWKMEFASMPIARQPFYEIIKTSGQILNAPGDEMFVIAKTSGVLLFESNNLNTGTAVNANTTLFRITGGDLTQNNIDVRFQEARINLDKAEVDLKRASELVSDNIVSQKEFQEIKQQHNQAKVTYQSISKHYSSKGKTIVAGMQGFIKHIIVSPGQYVEAGSTLAIISKNKRLMLQAHVSHHDVIKLPTIKSANFTTIHDGLKYNTSELNGKLISYGKTIAQNTTFMPIHFEIDNSANIIPGSLVEVFLKSSPIPQTIVIPKTALLEEQGHYFVYVQLGGELFQKREVQCGADDGVSIQIVKGLTEGERIVSKGAYLIKLASASGSLPAHGHEH